MFSSKAGRLSNKVTLIPYDTFNTLIIIYEKHIIDLIHHQIPFMDIQVCLKKYKTR